MFKKLLSSKKVKLTLFLSLVASFMLLAGNAHATATATENAIAELLCNAMLLLTGGAGRTFAAFAVIGVGLMFFGGKVTWGVMVGVAVGIGAIFGAPSIVSAITGGEEVVCGTQVNIAGTTTTTTP